jgi:uncharacterized protein
VDSATTLRSGRTRYGEPGWLRLEQLTLAVQGLPEGFGSLRIGQLSDLHVSRAIAPAYVAEAVALLNAQRPHLIVITGDFVTWGQGYLQAAVKSVASLQAPLGVYAVFGNHDHWCGAARLEALLNDTSIVVLRNAHRRIDLDGSPLWLLGLDDALLGYANLPQALHGVGGEGLRILLAHEPDLADSAARHGITLQLSGHTHGGQLRLPIVGPLLRKPGGRRYPLGLRQVPETSTWVYTNRGLGVSGFPLRWNCPPEVTLLTLVAASGD